MGADAGSGEWTGEKRRKHLGPSLHSEVPTSSADSPPAQGGEEDPFFTAADLENFDISLDEIVNLKNFEKDTVIVDRRCILDDETQRQVYKGLVIYRLKAHNVVQLSHLFCRLFIMCTMFVMYYYSMFYFHLKWCPTSMCMLILLFILSLLHFFFWFIVCSCPRGSP